jgi:molybdenum cofactor cytidylyltransferase
VGPDAIRAVMDAHTRTRAPAIRARYKDGPAHPVVLGRAIWPQVATISGDRGARDILAGHEVVEVEVAGSLPPDVDTPADHAELRARGG